MARRGISAARRPVRDNVEWFGWAVLYRSTKRAVNVPFDVRCVKRSYICHRRTDLPAEAIDSADKIRSYTHPADTLVRAWINSLCAAAHSTSLNKCTPNETSLWLSTRV
jgi:hypothetical protein